MPQNFILRNQTCLYSKSLQLPSQFQSFIFRNPSTSVRLSPRLPHFPLSRCIAFVCNKCLQVCLLTAVSFISRITFFSLSLSLCRRKCHRPRQYLNYDIINCYFFIASGLLSLCSFVGLFFLFGILSFVFQYFCWISSRFLTEGPEPHIGYIYLQISF